MKPVSIYTIPVLPKTNLPAPILPPNLEVPTPIVITPLETNYYAEVCKDYTSGEYTKEELTLTYPDLTRSNACDWAIYGFSVQGWFNVESKLALAGSYSQQLRDRITFLEGVIKDYESISDKQEEAIKKIK